ncbi:MAG: flagellar protein FlgN [Rhodocyclaceae bacterium]|nr:flagellar protein FlgN [Rhodocyclaceae bacterium]
MPAPLPPLAQTLEDEIGRLEAFIALLQREQSLLEKGETEALLPLIEQKNALAGALAGFDRSREHALARLGLPAGRAGMEAWLASQEGAPYQAQWERLLELAQRARDLNETNGRLIQLHLSHHQQALAALMNAANQITTYGPDGQQQGGLGGRILGKA